MSFVRCFPGHGEPFDDVTAAIEVNLSQIAQRTERVAAALRERGPSSLYDLCDALYPRALRRRFWQIAATVQGHLDILEKQGEAQFAHRSLCREVTPALARTPYPLGSPRPRVAMMLRFTSLVPPAIV